MPISMMMLIMFCMSLLARLIVSVVTRDSASMAVTLLVFFGMYYVFDGCMNEQDRQNRFYEKERQECPQ